MTVLNKLNQIHKYLIDNTISSIELKRIYLDLNSIYSRLEKNDYQRFGNTTNVFDVPNRTREIFTELEFYCELGKKWEAILKTINLKSNDIVVDLCAGFAPKVELGLLYSGFKGKAIVIDKDQNSFIQLQKLLNLFRPNFSLSFQKKDLFSMSDKYDFLLANHAIDDIVVDYYSQKFGISMTDVYEKEGSLLNIWQSILEKKEYHFHEMLNLLTIKLNEIINKDGFICLTQYESYFERILDMKNVTDFNLKLFHALEVHLVSQNFIKETELINKMMNFQPHFEASELIILKKIKN